ncbi:hypothetical protein DJ68_09000 [Halorubrum sp. C3]|nr:hypothetical protein DJ68_09000 [Halorubrum sp. C3]
MGADNVDVFQRLVFSVPPLSRQLPAMAVLGVVYSVVAFVAVSVAGVFLVAQFLVDSDLDTVAVLLVGCLAWAIGYEVGRRDAGQ